MQFVVSSLVFASPLRTEILGLVESLQYIHYRKASIVMYALKDLRQEATT